MNDTSGENKYKNKSLKGMNPNGTKKELIYNVCHGPVFPRTPKVLAKKMVSYIPQPPKDKKLKVLGLMSGNGNIEEWIDSDKYDITAVEKDEYRCLSGSYICYHHFHQRDAVQWICSDIYDDEFIMKYIIPGNYESRFCNKKFKIW